MTSGWSFAVLLVGVASINALGCGQAPYVAAGQRVHAALENSDRGYVLWLPPSYDGSTPTPVIFSFHGAGGTGEQQADLDLLTTPEFNTDHILVYPESAGGRSGGLWEVSPEVVDVDDVAYTLQIFDQIRDDLCIDETRVFATGMSQGGGMTNLLACDPSASTRFAAYAPVAGSYYFEEDADGECDVDNVAFQCSPGRDHIPLLAFHGGDDGTIPYEGNSRRGGCVPNVGHWISQWAVREGLGPDPTETEEVTEEATRYLYGGGDEQGLVSFVYAGREVGHVWPATVGGRGDRGTASFNASSLIMEFFRDHQLSENEDDSQNGPTSTGAPTSAPTPTSSTPPDPEESDTEGKAPAFRAEGAIWVSALLLLYTFFL
ncbi:hypothetical protein DL770_006360 [Monosporascus sp. CRB-9-2]|nr:hypothetical protein DL770_006360 [Monosporascus sp. CRB-9-2]